MATLPATGSQISFGRVHNAFTTSKQAGSVAGDAPAGGFNIKLSSVLGANATYHISDSPQTAGTPIKFSFTFGGKNSLNTY